MAMPTRNLLTGALARFRDDCRGSTLIETAFVLPVLVFMSLGGVEVANMVKRQHELQNTASKAAEIVMASYPKDDAEIGALMWDLKNMIKDDTGLDTHIIQLDSDADLTKDNVAYVLRRYRCGNSKSFKKTDGGCTDSTKAESFLVFRMRQKYSPVWKDFGLGRDMQYDIEKSVQIG